MPAALHFGAYCLTGPHGPLHRHDAEVKLPPKALAVLWLLASRSGQVVTRAAILDEVWTGTAVGEDALGFQVQLLRHALEDDPRHPSYIATVHRIGYRFVATVTHGPRRSDVAIRTSTALPRPPGGLDHALVGRDNELAQLHGHFGRALEGERQIVFVTGEAGIGKTTLVEAFLDRIAAGGEARIGRGQCVEHYGAGEAYLPLLDALGRLCGGTDGERLVQILRQHAPGALVQLPSFVPSETLDVLQRSVQGITRNRMLRELALALEALAADHPLVLLLEDLHWSDPSTVDLLAMVARRRQPARLLLLGTVRPVDLIVRGHPLKFIKQELAGTGQAVELPLGYLTAGAVRAFVALRLRDASNAGVAAFVHCRTEGHPLFMVQMTDYLAQQDSLLRAVAAGHHATTAIAQALPQRLRELIDAQIERLAADEQRVLEAGSVAGVEFAVASVAAATQMGGEAVAVICERLARSGQFIDDRGLATWPDGSVGARYGFRHALYHQVVSGRLGAGARARLHRAIGARKVSGYGERTAEIASELAVHFELGGDRGQAAHYYRHTAEKALRGHAYPEALVAVAKGLDLLERQRAGPEQLRDELLLQLTRGAALLATRGFSVPEVERAYTRAHALSQQLDDVPTLVAVLYGLWNFSLTRADLPRARTLADQLVALAGRHSEPDSLLPAYNARGWTEFFTGEPEPTDPLIDRSVALYDRDRHQTLAAVHGEDPGVVGHMCAALTRWWLGYPSRARCHLDEGLDLARTLAHPFGVAQMLWVRAVISQLCGDAERVLDTTRQLIALCADRDFPLWLTGGRILQGWALAEQGRPEQAASQIRQSIADWHAMGVELTRPYSLGLLAVALARGGEQVEALRVLGEAIEGGRQTGERWYDAELHRLRGEVVRQHRRDNNLQAGNGGPIDPEQCFLEAIDIARRQHAKTLELRAALSLARLTSPRIGRAQASRQLAAIHGWFAESDQTAELETARALLAR